MREIACLIDKGIQKTGDVLRAARVCMLVAYHMSRYIVLGDYDTRMVEAIQSLSEMNPLYVKVFQAIAGTSGILSPVVEEYLLRFSDDVPYNESDAERHFHIKEIIEYMRQQNPWLTIEELTDRPIHSGTVSLVYGGRIGEKEVVVKCVRSRIDARMRNAIEDATHVLNFLGFLPSVSRMKLDRVLAENTALLMEQTSMNHELDNLQFVREKLADRQSIVLPKPYPEYTRCDDGILVMERLRGKRIDDVKQDEKETYGLLLAEHVFDAIATNGIYHGDLHRGNILFMDDDGTKKLGLIDYGILGRLNDAEQLTLSSFYLSLGTGNYEDVVTTLLGTLANKDTLDAMDSTQRTAVTDQLIGIAEDACTGKEGFGPKHLRLINDIFAKNGLQLAPVFCRIELAMAMNASVSKSLETKTRNFMCYLQEAIRSKMDLNVYDV